MKIGFYCESPADQAAMAVFTEGILGQPLEPINMDLEAHSVPGFFAALDGVYRGVHYNSDAEGLIVVVDADDSPLHGEAHDAPGVWEQECRFCEIRKIIQRTGNQLKPRQGRSALKVAWGVAVPSIEAWYLAGKNHQVGEAAFWLDHRSSNRSERHDLFRRSRAENRVEPDHITRGINIHNHLMAVRELAKLTCPSFD